MYDKNNERILFADNLSASIDILALAKGKVVINSAWLSDFEIVLAKDSSNAPLNIQFVIDAFKSKNDTPSKKIDLKLEAIYFNDGRFRYDVRDKESKTNKFDQNHIQVSDFDAKIAIKSILPDSLNIQVKKIALKEQSGLEIKNLVFRVLTQDKKIDIKGFRLDLPSSFLELNDFVIDLTSAKDTGDIINYAQLNCKIAPSYIAPSDISPIVPALKHFTDLITLEGEIKGNIDNISIDNFSLKFGKKMNLLANAEIRDLRRKDKIFILGSIDDLTMSGNEIQNLINNFSKNKSQLPPQISNLGSISFQGDLSGYLNQLTAFGTLDTQLGILKTDLLFGFNPRKGIDSYVQGKIYTSDFQLGNLLNNKDFDRVSFNLAVDLTKPHAANMKGYAKGSIFQFDYKEYAYKDIILDVNYDGLRANGEVKIETPHGKLNIVGLADFSDKNRPTVNLTARADNIQFDKLNLNSKWEQSKLSCAVHANFSGKNLDDANGYLSIDSLEFIKGAQQFYLSKLLVETSDDTNNRKLKITSDLITGEAIGNFTFGTLAHNIKRTIYPYLSTFIATPEANTDDEKEDKLNFELAINNSESLSSILNLPVTVLTPLKLSGNYDNATDKFNLKLIAPSLIAAGNRIRDGYVEIENRDDVIRSTIEAKLLGKKESINEITIKSTLSDNVLNTNIHFMNDGAKKAKGELNVATKFSKSNGDPLEISLNIFPSEILLNNASWNVDKSKIVIQNGAIDVNDFAIYNKDGSQEIHIDGQFAKNNPNNVLKTKLKNIKLEYIFDILAIDALKFGGEATGDFFLSSVKEKPYANTNLSVKDFKFNGTKLGDLNLYSELDKETNKIILVGKIENELHKKTGVEGYIDPIKSNLSINFDADNLDISFLKQYTVTIFDKLSGRGSGKVRLFGDFSRITVEGKAWINDGNIGISFLNTNYSFSDTIYMKPDLIYFNDITFTDSQKNKALVSGKVSHERFSNFMYHIGFTTNNFLVYNATPKHNNLFYGKVFGSGKGSLGGDEKVLDINVSMRTEKNSSVRLNFMQEVVNEYKFITYKEKHVATDSTILTKAIPQKEEPSSMEMNMNFYIDATPDAVVELVMDPIGGDILRGSGSGAMQFVWNSKLIPRLYGTYTLNRGSYNFTFQRLMERVFSIEDGSRVQFRGDPFEAMLDVQANYKVTGNLNDLDKNIVENTGQTNIPVVCVLNLTGPLKFPTVGLDLKFPTVDSEVERQIKQFINTEDMINRQVTYLLLLSKFYTPQYADTNQRTSDFAAVASATLSNQLSKIVNQIDDRWQLGTNIRTSDPEFSTTEVELILSSRLLNDRLLINGNFGYRDGQNAQYQASPLIGEVDIEFLLNNPGTWRLKAYNHYNEKYYYSSKNGGIQTQGIGILYKKDFDEFKYIFKTPKFQPFKIDTMKPFLPNTTKKRGLANDSLKTLK